jgi:putative heme-binding domain-containing protein
MLSLRILCLFVLVAAAAAFPAAADDASPAQRARDAVIVRTLLRLPGVDLDERPEAKAALVRHLETLRGSEQWLEIAEKFPLRETRDELLQLAMDESNATRAVKAAGLLVKLDERQILAKALDDREPAQIAALITTLGLLADARTNDLVLPRVTDSQQPLAVRSAAVGALARNAPGQKALLAIVERGQLAEDLQFAAANGLLSSADEAVRTAAAKHLSLPAAAGGEPLPPIAELVKRLGDAARGQELFATTGTCAKCHKVRGEGKDVGPDLSEIGSKLSKEALYLSILDPSAGISFDYETWLVRTFDGTVISGIIVSRTDEGLELKTAEAIVHKLAHDDVESLQKQPISLMPADLQKQLSAEDLIDIVEYLTTLRKT